MTASEPLLAGLELGGTKCVALIARGRDILRKERVPTGDDPSACLGALAALLRDWRSDHPFEAIGIASFGPVRVDPRATDYGHILATPKPGWSGADLLGPIRAVSDVPIAVDTDVNGAALAEAFWGGSGGLDVHAYVTVGTGVGVGIVVDGKPLHGRLHPEAGHLMIAMRGNPEGICPFHGNCVEGLASGTALSARAGRPLATLDASDPVWDVAAESLGGLAAALLLTIAPRRIAFGGGVIAGQPWLVDAIAARTSERLNGYSDVADMRALIAPAALGDLAGPLGAIAIAQTIWAEGRSAQIIP